MEMKKVDAIVGRRKNGVSHYSRLQKASFWFHVSRVFNLPPVSTVSTLSREIRVDRSKRLELNWN
jgi:hypothetical protein